MRTVQEALDTVASLSTQQRWTRSFVVVAPQVCLVATAAAAGGVAAAIVILVLLLSFVAALWPDSHVPLVLIAVLVWQWAITVDDVRTPWALFAAAAILVVHSAAAAATIAPPPAILDRATQVRWLRRVAVVATITVAAWLTTIGVGELDTGGNVALVAAGTGAALGIVALVWPRERSPDQTRGDRGRITGGGMRR